MNREDFTTTLASMPTDVVIHAKDDTYLLLHRLMFHWTLQKYDYPDWTGYDESWCFATRELAFHAIAEWRSRGFEGEPEGWHRHPKSGRRRPEGDPAQEYIAH
jgi:hypothetical protein